MAELFERHDRKKFELIAFSFGQDKNDEMRSRIKAAFDRFIDVREYSDNDVARLSRELEIDIAVDLKGFTKNCRTGIFAARAAPIQVNYLGYPGTMSAEYIDYIIADPTLIPENCKLYYSEKIAYLPHSYQVNDATREVSARTFSRIELGLPETGFVFCCFNNNYKITPSTFNVWMRIMKQVEGSVLWLYEDNPIAAKNLRIEAEKRGISNERLIFARHMSASEHLARHRVADLFLDTSPYNAHTTASDALWTGLPVLTCPGKSFASRVAASLLGAIHLPELVTRSMEEYEALAIELATNPSKLPELKARLDENRLTTPLFDIQLFTKHIENLYLAMYSAKRRNIKFDHIMAVAEN
jgi:predicted O-linked N-acetylglucosamine transferase (SPINDLY family)